MRRRGLLLALALAGVSACTTTALTDPVLVTGGNAERGRVLIAEYGCASCHVVPGVDRVQGTVGPPLGDFGRREAVAGQLPHTPENAIAWIRFPQKIEPDTLMPDLGVSEQDARDILAYLYSLE